MIRELIGVFGPPVIAAAVMLALILGVQEWRFRRDRDRRETEGLLPGEEEP